jgi:hypothetical protein
MEFTFLAERGVPVSVTMIYTSVALRTVNWLDCKSVKVAMRCCLAVWMDPGDANRIQLFVSEARWPCLTVTGLTGAFRATTPVNSLQ